MRGSSGLPAGVDTALQSTKTDSTLDIFVEKQKDGEDGQHFYMRAEKVELLVAPGSLKPRDSLVLVPSEKQSGSHRQKLPDQPRRAREMLVDLIAAEGEPLPTSPGFPSDRKGVWKNRWRECCRTKELAGSDEPRQQTNAFNRCFEKLTAVGLVGALEGWVWPI
jgi:hypothetical protein